MRKKQYKIFAAIHLGSEMISMQIVQYRNLNNIKILEECNRRVRLGEETFKNKIIPFSMVNEICELLVGFKRLMTEYEVEEYSMQATTAVREALNRVFLIDQIYIRTGLKVTVIDLPEEIYTKYQSIRRTMKLDGLTGVDESMLMMDISSGGLGITFVKDNVIRYQQNLNIGVIRVKESFNRNQRSSMKFNQALAEYLSSTMGAVRDALKNEQVRYLVLSGAESELLLQMLGIEFKAGVIRIKTEQFMQLFKTVHALNLPQIIKVFKINEDIAELVVPTILLYEQLLALVQVQEIILTDDRFIDGICLLHIGPKTNRDYAAELEQEVVVPFGRVVRQGHRPEGLLYLGLRDLQALEPLRQDGLGLAALHLRLPGYLGETVLDDLPHPALDLPPEEQDVLGGVVGADVHGVAFDVRGPADVHDVDQGVRLPEVVEELVSQTLALPCVGDKSRDVQELHGDHPGAVHAQGVVRGAGDTELPAGAGGADVGDALVGLDGCEWIVGDLHGCHGGRPEECGFADVRLSYDTNLHVIATI